MGNINFNDHLDDMMQRLMDEKLTPDQLELEIKRGKALSMLVDRKIEDKKVTVMALEAVGNIDFEKETLPHTVKKLFQIEDK